MKRHTIELDQEQFELLESALYDAMWWNQKQRDRLFVGRKRKEFLADKSMRIHAVIWDAIGPVHATAYRGRGKKE